MKQRRKQTKKTNKKNDYDKLNRTEKAKRRRESTKLRCQGAVFGDRLSDGWNGSRRSILKIENDSIPMIQQQCDDGEGRRSRRRKKRINLNAIRKN
ncbi:hypothetical protein QR98_0044940 [Sarcoptes scabiei]|uniref:Uncharacterized protein n=1 Tax=Sarcoptes scabiei TaxID=52283 RepID=A0A132A4X1_SARSC|nr:hypothetical protein QR98_0044940 [Sarcoptes scabiei]